MSKIKEQDILRLLDGAASAKKLKKLQEWSLANPDNALELEMYQRIYDEAAQLSSYKKVNPKKAWKSFSAELSSQVTEAELLKYFDGAATPEQTSKIQDWKSLSKDNQDDFQVFDTIIKESKQIKGYNHVDVDSEWMSFQKALATKKSEPVISAVSPKKETQTIGSSTSQAKEVTFTPSPVYVQKSSNQRWLWRTVAVAASLLLLSMFLWTIWQNNAFGIFGNNGQELYATFETNEYPDVLNLSDGSVIALDKYSSVEYFTDVNKVEERAITLTGKGEFNVQSINEKPFIVKAQKTGVGVRVLGTKFRFEEHDDFIEVIENLEGSVRAYSLADTSIAVTLSAGDKYGWDGVKFVNLKDLEKEYVGKEYNIEYVLDYIMEKSEWRVYSGSRIPFDGDAMVLINLEQPYEDIMRDLLSQADFEYAILDCDGCYVITRFLPFSEN